MASVQTLGVGASGRFLEAAGHAGLAISDFSPLSHGSRESSLTARAAAAFTSRQRVGDSPHLTPRVCHPSENRVETGRVRRGQLLRIETRPVSWQTGREGTTGARFCGELTALKRLDKEATESAFHGDAVTAGDSGRGEHTHTPRATAAEQRLAHHTTPRHGREVPASAPAPGQS